MMKWEQKAFLGEIETEIIGMRSRPTPGEQVNLEREADTIRVEDGCFHPVGYLPHKVASWLAPLIDSGQIHLEGYVPKGCADGRCPINLMVFQCTDRFLQETEPKSNLDVLHQFVLEAYHDAQSYNDPELVLEVARRLRPLEEKGLLPESRLLLALLPRMAHELCMSRTLLTMARFRELLGTLTIGQPSHHHNLTVFPLSWPDDNNPFYTLFGGASAVVEEIDSTLAVTNHCDRPLLIPGGEAIRNRNVATTVLVERGKMCVLDCDGMKPQPAISFAAEEELMKRWKRSVLPDGAAGIVVGCHARIIGIDLFDSPTTLKTLSGRLDTFLFHALHNPRAAKPTPVEHALAFIVRLSGVAKPRVPGLALGDELLISGEGVAGSALLFDGKLCHLVAFSDSE